MEHRNLLPHHKFLDPINRTYGKKFYVKKFENNELIKFLYCIILYYFILY